MALPVTLSGLWVGRFVSGPFKSSAGRFYLFGSDGTNDYQLDVFKATDPTSSWSQVSSVSTTSSRRITDLATYKVGDTIHIVLGIDNASLADYRYFVYDLSTESFTTSNEAIQTSLSTGSFFSCSIVVRSTGDVIVAYAGATAAVMGTSYTRVRYASRVSGVWTTATIVDPQGSVSWGSPECCIGLSDRTHIFYSDGTNTGQRTLNSSNVLQTASATVTIGTGPRQAASYNDSGTYRVMVSGTSGVGYFNSADSPTISAVSITNMSDPARLFIDG